MAVNRKDIEQAYLYLKSYVYHENLNLFLKTRVAAFECYKPKLAFKKINELLAIDDLKASRDLNKWIGQINYGNYI